MFRWHQQNQEAQENARTGGGGPVMFSLNPLLRDPATGAMPSAMPPTQGSIPPVPSNGLSQAPIPSMGTMPGTIPPMPFGMPGMMPGNSVGANRWTMGEDGREVDVNTGQHRIKGYSRKQPPIPFGGFRANGGPVRPGMAYVVGERGPELMVPSAPGMIVPNGGSRVAQSPMNRPYAELVGGTGSLANRGVRQIGRSINDPQRAAEIAMRRLRQSGDVVGAARLAQSNAFFQDRMGRSMPMMAPPMMPMAARERLAPLLDANTGMPVPSMDEPMPDLPANAAPMEPAPPPLSFEQAFQQSPLGNSGPPPLSTAMQVPFDTPPEMMAKLNAGSFAGVYGRAPAPVATMPIPGTDYVTPIFNGKPSSQTLPVKPSGTTGYAPVQGVPGLMVPTGPGADKLPPMQQTPNPGWSVTGQPKTRMEPMGGATPKAPSGIQYTYDAAGNVTGGVYPRYNPATGRFVISKLDLDGDGVPDVQQGGAGAAAGAAKVPAWKSLMQ